VGRGFRGRNYGGDVIRYNISLIGIVTMNCPLYNKYILIKIIFKKTSQRQRLINVEMKKWTLQQILLKFKDSCLKNS
jgi:hypothetical protein